MKDEVLNKFYEAGEFFLFGFLELSILFLAVSFLVEIINIFMDPQKVQKVLSSNKSGYLIASALGAITPFCSCSTIPMTLGLLKARASFGAIMTFLFTSPLLNPIVVIVFWSSFGYKVTLVYAFIAFFVSILAGVTLDKLGFKKYVKEEIFKEDEIYKSCCKERSIKKDSFPSKFSLKAITKSYSLSSSPLFVKEIKIENKWKQIMKKRLFIKTWKQFLSFAPYITIGITIGAFVHGFVPSELLSKYASEDNILAVPISALIGVPLYIRASSMVGLAPALLDGGVSMGAILALTVAGAGASLPEMIMLKKIFKLPIMIFFIVCVFTMAIVCGYLVNIFFT